MSSVPTIDLTPWFAGSERDRRAVAGEVDRALQSVGFFLLTGHGVTADERARVRAAVLRPACRGQAGVRGDAYWFPDNVFPTEITELRECVTGYLARMRALADELLTIAAMSLRQPDDFFTRHTGHSTHTMNINWYPPMSVAGAPADGPDRAAHRFRHLHHPGPGTRQGRSAGVEPGR